MISVLTNRLIKPRSTLRQKSQDRLLLLRWTHSIRPGLSTQALIYMGEIPPAPGQPPQTDLAAAQQMIDVLAMLKEKTAGNLDAGEEMMLENALFDLRMRYVELAKKGHDSSLSERRD